MRPIKCDEIQFSIMDCIERELSTDDVLAHLESCEHCQEEYRDYAFILRKLQNVEVKEPSDAYWQIFPGKVLAQVNEVKQALSADSGKTSHFESIGIDKRSREDNDKLVREDKVNVIPFHQSDSLSANQTNSKRTTGTVNSLFFSSSLSKVLLPIAATILMTVGIVGYLKNETASPAVGYSHNTLAFQAQINKITPVSKLVRQLPTNGLARSEAGNAWYSFSAQPIKVNPFFVGAHYTEILALSDDTDTQASSEHMMQLRHELLKTQLSDDLVTSSEQAENILASKDSNQKDRVRALSDFESKYRNFLAADVGDDALVFFQLGGWVVNMSLAALAENPIVKLEQPNIEYFSAALLRLSAPLGVMTILEDIDKLIKKSELTKNEYNKIYRLSLKLRTQLS